MIFWWLSPSECSYTSSPAGQLQVSLKLICLTIPSSYSDNRAMFWNFVDLNRKKSKSDAMPGPNAEPKQQEHETGPSQRITTITYFSLHDRIFDFLSVLKSSTFSWCSRQQFFLFSQTKIHCEINLFSYLHFFKFSISREQNDILCLNLSTNLLIQHYCK